jgi:hypothetical protein
MQGDIVEDTIMYICILGDLIYMTITRLDLSYAIEVVSQFMQTPILLFYNVEFLMRPIVSYKYMDT